VFMGKLTALAVQRATRPGRYGDGDGLYLQVGPTGTKSWFFRYRLAGSVSSNGKPMSREMGLGSLATFTLAQARERAREQRQLVAQGLDPIAERDKAAARQSITFAQALERYMRQQEWRNAKHRKQWASTLQNYAKSIMPLDVAAVERRQVLAIVEPIWWKKNETANRVRGRIEIILDWAKAHQYRDGENPARFKGNLDIALKPRSKVRKVQHHAALPYSELPAFMQALSVEPGLAALALTFTILTCARTGETIGARWSEIDLEQRVWTVPANRTKGGRDHQVPLSDQALAILNTLRTTLGVTAEPNAFVFPGRKRHRALSNMAMLKILERMDRADVTTHGMRSSFRIWVAEATDFPREVAEAALAHVIADKTEAAYQRSTFFEKRRRMMSAWSDFCTGGQGSSDVIPWRR
jgi:integrase